MCDIEEIVWQEYAPLVAPASQRVVSPARPRTDPELRREPVATALSPAES